MNTGTAIGTYIFGFIVVVLIGVVIVKEVLFRFVMQGADQFDSDAARADAWHHRSDAITSIRCSRTMEPS